MPVRKSAEEPQEEQDGVVQETPETKKPAGKKTAKVVKENVMLKRVEKYLNEYKLQDDVEEALEKRVTMEGVTKPTVFVTFKDPADGIGKFLYNHFASDNVNGSLLMFEVLEPTEGENDALLVFYELDANE